MADQPEDLELFLSQVDAFANTRKGDLLRGRVISHQPFGMVIDLGLKRDGVVPREDLERLPPDEPLPKPGDEVAVMVVVPLDEEGNLLVSLAQARESGDWLLAQRMMEDEDILEAVPRGFNRGGLTVPFGRLRGFAPASHLSEVPRGVDEETRVHYLEKMIGRRLPFRIIEVDPQRQRLVLSERKAIRQWRQEQKSRILEELREGEIRKGTVTSLREFGAFVDIGGADGLIHVSELSWQRVEDPAKVLHIGQEVEAMVIRLDRQGNRIGLSLKRLLPNPWQEARGRITIGQCLSGRVSYQSAGGTYVRIEGGLDGLLKPNHAQESLFTEGEIRVRVAGFDPERERLDLEWIAEASPTGTE
ncbi:MAG TPA: S1 RNA-binding domain-containing protein [Anaerolineales bacterium]|nr:S1 RNA-binding domain-containing protein [Anaerolineales bacterium]